MATIYRISMTQAQYSAYIAVPTNIIPSNYQIFITDAPAGAPNLYAGDGTNTPAAGALDGEGGNTLVTNWTASTALNAGQIVLATVAVGGFVVGEHISSNTSRTTGATFNATEAGNFTSVPEDTTILKKSDVIDNLASSDTDKPVSAKQAKALQDGKAAVKIPIQDYSATATYAVGDQIIQSLKIYECKTAITAGEAFTASKWDEISVGATGAKAPTIHVAATTLAITEASHNNAEIHLEGTGNLTILNTDITTDTFGFTVINTDSGATRTLTPTGFAGVFKRSGGANVDLTNVAFNIADNAKYRFTVTLSGANRYLNIEDLNVTAPLTTQQTNALATIQSAPVRNMPTMTANTTAGTLGNYIASASSSYVSGNYPPWAAMRGVSTGGATNQEWACGTQNATVWLRLQYPSAKTVTRIIVRSRAGADNFPIGWKLQGSNNGTDFTDLYTSATAMQDVEETINIVNTTAYLYYRIEGYNAGSWAGMRAFWLYEDQFSFPTVAV